MMEVEAIPLGTSRAEEMLWTWKDTGRMEVMYLNSWRADVKFTLGKV